jgi:uncharacterized protein
MANEYYTLITGASEGFGKALAIECANRGMNLILVSLPQTGLKNLVSFIKRNYEVKALYFEYDLTQKENHPHLFSRIKELSLSVNILINNAGMGGTHFFTEKDADYYRRQIELNVIAPTLLIYFFINTLCNDESPAHILNVSSLAGFFHLPRKQVYGGTKSYLVSFSKSLRSELLHKKIYVSTVCPGGMNTSLPIILLNKTGNPISRLSIMNPEDVAKIAIKKMFQNKELIIPGNWNRVFFFLDKLLPPCIKRLLTGRLMKQLKPAVLYSPIGNNINVALPI